MIYLLVPLIPLVFYLIANRRKRFDDPFMSGFDYRARRIKYRDPWIIFSFLFVIFEEFLILTIFLSPKSLEVFVFYSIMVLSILMVVIRWYYKYS